MKRLCFLFLSVLPLASPAKDLSSPVLLSQGGSGGASLNENLSYLINPAVIGFQNKRKGAVLYSFKKNNQTALLSFLDNKTQLPMAITYQRFWSHSFRKSEKDKMLFSSGFKISPYFSLGLNVEKELSSSAWNGGLGSVLKLGQDLSLAAFLNQVLKKEDKNQRVLSLALYHKWKSFFSSQLDISRTSQKEWIIRGGLETLFQDFLSLRLGAVWLQKIKKGLISGGLAFQSPKLMLEYSIQKDDKDYQQALVLIFRL